MPSVKDGDNLFSTVMEGLIALPVLLLLHSVTSTSADSLDPFVPWSVRIYTGNSSVQVSSDGTSWHTLRVRTSNSLPVSSVVCRQLGLGPPLVHRAVPYTTSPDGATVGCDGSEPTVDSCLQLVAPGPSNFRRIYIEECLPLHSTDDYNLALSRSNYSSSEGIPLVYLGGQWQPICERSDLSVTACRQLGLGDDSDQGFQTGREFPGISQVPYFECDHSDEFLSECSMRTSSSGSCTSASSYLTLYCSHEDNTPGFRFVTFPFWLIGVLGMFACIWGIRYYKYRALSNENNTAGTATVVSSVPVTTTQQDAHSTAAYPRQTQVPMGSADPPPAYPGIGNPAYPPPASPPPAYDQALGQQNGTNGDSGWLGNST